MTVNASPTRRRFLALAGTGVAAGLVGCTGDNGSGPTYQDGDVNVSDNASDRNTSETSAATASAETTVDPNVSSMEALEIERHEFSYEGGYTGSTVQGVVENTGTSRLSTVEVRVRVYNDDGEQLGRYVDSTGDLAGGSTWSFQVILLESPSDIASYDITVLGLPA